MFFVQSFRHFSIEQFVKVKETHSKLVFAKNQNIRKKNRISKNHSKVIMASLLQQFELQRESCRRDLKIRSNYRGFRITEIRITESKL